MFLSLFKNEWFVVSFFWPDNHNHHAGLNAHAAGAVVAVKLMTRSHLSTASGLRPREEQVRKSLRHACSCLECASNVITGVQARLESIEVFVAISDAKMRGTTIEQHNVESPCKLGGAKY